MDASLYRDNRNLNSITFGDLIDRYTEEIGAIRPFGKNTAAVARSLTAALGRAPLSSFNAERLDAYGDQRRAGGAGGVTVGTELSYIGAS
ncbi:hypothetical protein ACFQ09_16195 [Massilia norwichensis]|uniref:Uncharacterized protein n=1 Tax=Massilia norwichensis TaxID=1442366 RepID=A0ABT2AEI8_9BURK|nr:hypothetical protein [Massilia norwichensis]MCS0592626.1 hypothetical protein [Massilia norwichensis]